MTVPQIMSSRFTIEAVKTLETTMPPEELCQKNASHFYIYSFVDTLDTRSEAFIGSVPSSVMSAWPANTNN